jgi:hypothetical protein
MPALTSSTREAFAQPAAPTNPSLASSPPPALLGESGSFRPNPGRKPFSWRHTTLAFDPHHASSLNKALPGPRQSRRIKPNQEKNKNAVSTSPSASRHYSSSVAPRFPRMFGRSTPTLPAANIVRLASLKSSLRLQSKSSPETVFPTLHPFVTLAQTGKGKR